MDRLLFFLAKLFVKGSDPKSEVKPCAIHDKQNVSINKMQLEIWESFIQKVLAKCRHMCTKQCSTSTDFSSSISKVPTLSLYHNLGLRNNTLLRQGGYPHNTFRAGVGLHIFKPTKAVCAAWALILLSSLLLTDPITDLLSLKASHGISLCAYITFTLAALNSSRFPWILSFYPDNSPGVNQLKESAPI